MTDADAGTMDAASLAGIVTAIGGAIAAVVGAVALLLKLSPRNSRTVQSLRSLWEWVEAAGYADAVPKRLAAAVVKIIDDPDNS